MTKSHRNLVMCEMTRNVALSKSTTSSAEHTSQKSSSWIPNCSTFGIKLFTMVDHARNKVSSHIDVAKHFMSNLCYNSNQEIKMNERYGISLLSNGCNSRAHCDDLPLIAACFSKNIRNRSSAYIRSILWRSTNTFAEGEFSSTAVITSSNLCISASILTMSNT